MSFDHIFIYKYNQLRSSKFYYSILIIKNVSEQQRYNCLSKQNIIAFSSTVLTKFYDDLSIFFDHKFLEQHF